MTSSIDTATIEAQALANCGSEQIHIPGSIQPHGVLLALYPDGSLAAFSVNASAVLGALPAIGERFGANHLNAAARDAIAQRKASSNGVADPITLQIHQDLFDVVMHDADGLLIVEFEKRIAHSPPPFEDHARVTQHAISMICGARNLYGMLDTAVDEIRRLTGFDRVMAYQFLYDDSGEVIAESKIDGTITWLGLRFPASDIPPQARRLYVASPIRLIADCDYLAVPIVPSKNPLTGNPFDMSHSTLRSVSPVHVEYLKNMGVAASMSISIIVGGRLWGLFACHHATPRLVPHALRIACVVLSDIASAVVERHVAQIRVRELESVDTLKQTILAAADSAAEMRNAFDCCGDAMLKIVDASGYAIAIDGTCATYGDALAPAEILGLIAGGLLQDGAELFATNKFNPEPMPTKGNRTSVCGVMATCFEPEQNGYVFWFRNEQIESVRWAGNPQKEVVTDSVGTRLTPRASFLEWQQEVQGQSSPWIDNEKEIAIWLKHELQGIALGKSTRLRLEREKLWATLGHDLRMPLHAIMMLAGQLGLSLANPEAVVLTKRIAASSKRMDRLISDVMDISKLQSGLGLGVAAQRINLNTLVQEIIQETKVAYPAVKIDFETAFDGNMDADPDRLSQVLTNLLGNAIAHGERDTPVTVFSGKTAAAAYFTVSNRAEVLDAHLLANIFSPYRSGESTSPRNRQGLGLGLHIANEIVKSHRGMIDVAQHEGTISFTVSIPAVGDALV